MCGRWFSLQEDDGQLDRTLTVAEEEEINSFDHVFFSTARNNLTEEHLWISVLSRPTKSYFTRVERLTCCLSLLFTTMLANAMWYGAAENVESDQVLRVGPIVFSAATLLVSLFSNLTVMPINVLIVMLFRKSKPRHYVDILDGAASENNKGLLNRSKNPYIVGAEKQPDPEKNDTTDGAKSSDDDPKNKDEPKAKKKRWGKYVFPWWGRRVAWGLAIISVLVSVFFVLLYSLEWGKLKSEEWLSALFFSFIQSILLEQPLKVNNRVSC